MAQDTWIGLESNSNWKQCGRSYHTEKDCSGFATWPDGSALDTSIVPGMAVTMDYDDSPMHYAQSLDGVDDRNPSYAFQFVCELKCD